MSLGRQDFRGVGPQAGDPDLRAHCLMRFDKVSHCFTGTVGSKIASADTELPSLVYFIWRG